MLSIKEVFDESDKDKYFLPSVILLKGLLKLTGSPWRDWGGRNQPLILRGLARMLRAYDIPPAWPGTGHETAVGTVAVTENDFACWELRCGQGHSAFPYQEILLASKAARKT